MKIWYRELSNDEMKGFTICESLMKGNLISWNIEDWMFTPDIEPEEYYRETVDFKQMCSQKVTSFYWGTTISFLIFKNKTSFCCLYFFLLNHLKILLRPNYGILQFIKMRNAKKCCCNKVNRKRLILYRSLKFEVVVYYVLLQTYYKYKSWFM